MKQINKDSLYESCMELRNMLSSLEEDQRDLYFEEFVYQVQYAYINILSIQLENEK